MRCDEIEDVAQKMTGFVAQRNTVSSSACQANHPPIVIYNRLPKCGSTTMKHLVHELSIKNQFTDVLTDLEGSTQSVLDRSLQTIHKHAKPWIARRSNFTAAASAGRLRSSPKRFMFVQHIPHFALDDLPVPVAWINIARHPIELTQSWWYYMVDPTVRPLGRAKRTRQQRKASRCGCHKLTYNQCVLTAPQRQCTAENLQLMDVTLQYFCGMGPECSTDTERRYELALQTLRTNYTFVGLTDQIELSMKVLSKLLPGFFNGADEILRRGSVVGKVTTPYPELTWPAAKMLMEYPGNKFILKFWKDIEALFWEKVRGCGMNAAR